MEPLPLPAPQEEAGGNKENAFVYLAPIVIAGDSDGGPSSLLISPP